MDFWVELYPCSQAFPLQLLLYLANRLFKKKIWIYHSLCLAHHTHTHQFKTLQSLPLILGHRQNKTIFYFSTRLSSLIYMSLHALCTSQNMFLPMPHIFHILIIVPSTPAISSALKNVLFLPNLIDSYPLYKFQVSYHFFIWLPRLGQIPYCIFIATETSPSMYFSEFGFHIYFWSYLVNSSLYQNF